MQDTALRIKMAVLALKRFTVAQLCEYSGLRRSQVDPVLGDLKKSGLLVTLAAPPTSGSAAHRPVVELEITKDVSRVRKLADEIFEVRRVVTPPAELAADRLRLTTHLRALELVAEAFGSAVALKPVERAQLREVEQLLQTVHGYLEAESFRTCKTFEELQEQGDPLFDLWTRWQRCTEHVRGVIERWGGATERTAQGSAQSVQLALATVPKLQEGFEELEKLSAGLERMDSAASFVCKELRRHFDRLELCAIQRIRQDSIIETVYGEGRAEGWVGLSKHRVAREQSLRDIQADVVLRKRAEVIHGYDARLDRYLYKRFEHAGFVRIFVPLVVFRDERGELQEPPDDCWQHDRTPETPHGRIVLSLKGSPKLIPDVFGTVETGFRFKNDRDTIGAKEALAIAAYVTKNADLLYRHSLDFALEQAVERIRELADGDSAVLRLLGPSQTPASCMPYVLTRRNQRGRMVRFGAIEPSGGIGSPPRPNGIGRRSVKLGTYVVLPDRTRGDTEETLKLANPDIYKKDNVRTLVAFPLNMGPDDGVVYVHYLRDRAPDEDALQSAWMLTKRCSQVLGMALEHDRLRDKAQQMNALNRVLMSLVTPRDHSSSKGLAEAIVWNTHNFLAADVVTFYEYDEAAGRFTGHIESAGRLKDQTAATGPAASDDVRWLVLNSESGAIFASDVKNDSVLNGSRKKDGTPSFIQREEIESTAAIVLKADDERVGVLFANFRAPREFNPNEQELVTRLAEGCAVALKNLRKSRVAASRRTAARAAASSDSAVPQQVPGTRSISELLESTIKSYKQVSRMFGTRI